MSVTTVVPESPLLNPTPVPRELVHKAAFAEVLLTGWRRTAEWVYEVTAQWPRDHGYWRTRRGRQDPILMVETVRQVFPLLSHAAFDMPWGHQLIWDCFSWNSFSSLNVTDRPADVTLTVTVGGTLRQGGPFRGASLHIDVDHEGRRIGTATTDYTAHAPAVYRRLRGAGVPEPRLAMAAAVPVPAPVSPERVGRETPGEVVLAPTGRPGRWQLRVDTTSPWLFDHPVDHVPGMLLMEAARQAAHLVAAPQETLLVGIDVDFHRYVELDAPCWVDVTPAPSPGGGATTVLVRMVQGGREVCVVTVEVAPFDRA